MSVRRLIFSVLVPVYMFAAPFARLALWLLGWSLALAAIGAWWLTATGEDSLSWRGLLFAFASGACHWMRSVLPRRP